MTTSLVGRLASLPARIAKSLMARARDARLVSRYVHIAEQLASSAEGVEDEGRLFDLVHAIPEFRPAQIRSEFTELMRRVRAREPAAALEIGTATGGTAFLLARMLPPGARLLTLDIADNAARRAAVRAFSTRTVRVEAVVADSHDPRATEMVKERLGSTTVPFVFIDGDHSYESVAADFRIHSALVPVGGCLAFHDIVQDSLTRHGRDTGTRTGGVPRFWRDLKARFPSAMEIVEDQGQDGFGIGFLPWTAEAAGSAESTRIEGHR